MESFDLLLEDDLQIKDGDLVIGDADDYNILYTLYGRQGQLYAHPTIGINFQKFEKAKIYDGRFISRDVKSGLEADGYETTDLKLEQNIDTREITVSVRAKKRRSTL